MDARANRTRDRPGGFTCPICAVTAHAVTDSRARAGHIWRRRVCSNQHKFSTVEAVDGGRTARLNGLTALLDSLSPDDFVLVGTLAARLARGEP